MAVSVLEKKFGKIAPEKLSQTRSMMLSFFLQFVFTGSLSLNGKLWKVYSGIRPEFLTTIYNTHSPLVSSSGGSSDADDAQGL
eukprot:6543651-Karenia_brevis.AAC.1